MSSDADDDSSSSAHTSSSSHNVESGVKPSSDPVMPNVPQVSGEESTTACPSMSSDADGDATDEEEEEGVGGMWVLTEIYTEEQLKKSKPIMCSTKGCKLVACSRWESTGWKPWNSCLVCQEA